MWVILFEFQKAKSRTQEQLSTTSFLDQMLMEGMMEEWLQQNLPITDSMRKNSDWCVRNIVDAREAAITIPTKHPAYITFIRGGDVHNSLKPSMIAPIFDKAKEIVNVKLYNLVAFFEGEHKSHDSNELLSLCLSHEK